MDGLVFVQIVTFFSVAYLIVRAMLERLDPSMEEAARYFHVPVEELRRMVVQGETDLKRILIAMHSSARIAIPAAAIEKPWTQGWSLNP